MSNLIQLTKEIIPSKYRSIKSFVTINNIKHYYYKLVDNEWIESDGKSNRYDKIFIEESTYNKYFKPINHEVKSIDDDNNNETCYEIIKLEDHEKFKDENGDVMEIETVGEREPDKIFFKATDVEKCFGISRLAILLNNKTSSYKVNTHYIYMYFDNQSPSDDINNRCKIYMYSDNQLISNVTNNTCKSTCKSSQKHIFLTYQGLLKVLFTTRNNKTSTFIKYATTVLFATQFGTDQQKNKLISDIKGISYDSITEIFNANATETPCIYLSSLNNVSNLRESMNIPSEYDDNDIVLKFGRTNNNFSIRKNGHRSEFKELEKVLDFKLLKYGYIDPLHICKAEKELDEILNEYKFKYKNHDEIVILPQRC